MADPKELFGILKATTGGAGIATDQAIDATTAASTLNGLVGFAFKNSAGNVVLPQLNASGQLPVTLVVGVAKAATGELPAGSLTIVAVTSASITLTVNKVYNAISFLSSSRQASLLQLIWSNNGVDTVLAENVTGPGQYTLNWIGGSYAFTAGATGVQLLSVKAKNFELLSSLRSSISCMEN